VRVEASIILRFGDYVLARLTDDEGWYMGMVHHGEVDLWASHGSDLGDAIHALQVMLRSNRTGLIVRWRAKPNSEIVVA
jgi:hypothetical protein